MAQLANVFDCLVGSRPLCRKSSRCQRDILNRGLNGVWIPGQFFFFFVSQYYGLNCVWKDLPIPIPKRSQRSAGDKALKSQCDDI